VCLPCPYRPALIIVYVLMQVQTEFADRQDVYLNFLSIVREFKSGKYVNEAPSGPSGSPE
jgi:histone deacetylase complex regulatory component SIN3